MKFSRREISPFALFFAFALAAHFLLPLNWGDDKIFNAESAMKLSDFLYGSSRILTDTMTYVFSKYHILWRLLNPFVLTLLPYVLSKLLIVCDRKIQAVLCGCILFPTMVMVDAGFIATTVNYLWPVTFGMTAVLIFQNIAANKKVQWYIKAAGIILLIYAINMEQMSAVLTGIFAIGLGYLYAYRKKFRIYPLVQFLISGFGVVYAYVGNTAQDNSRMVREISRYFPDFELLGVFQKIELGFSSTMYCMTMDLRFAFIGFITFTLFLAVMLFKKTKQPLGRITALLPIISSVVLAVTNLIHPFGELRHYRMTKAAYSFSPLADIFFATVLLCVMCTLAVILKDRMLTLKVYVILAAGFASRMLMGFSPTVWASGYRTFCIMFISFIIVTVIILNRERTVRTDSLVGTK